MAQTSDLEREKKLSAQYLKKMEQEAGAMKLEQGVVLRPIFVGSSDSYPLVEDKVSVLYHLMDRDGKLIQESLSSDQMLDFPLNRLIVCWKLALPKMPVGSWFKLSCPSDTAYGDRGAGDDIKPGAAITFRIFVAGVE